MWFGLNLLNLIRQNLELKKIKSGISLDFLVPCDSSIFGGGGLGLGKPFSDTVYLKSATASDIMDF